MAHDPDAEIRGMIARLDAEETAILEAVKKLTVRLNRVRAAREPLRAIHHDEPIEFNGSLADACRLVLKNREGKSLKPQQVRDAVKAIGYDLSRHDNVMATIHGVLKSLHAQREVGMKEWKKEPGVTRYFWIPSINDVLGLRTKATGVGPSSQTEAQLLGMEVRKHTADDGK